ncbi:hypothetical protein PRIPAC_95772 [Pristionchus pacificus]|uniref:Uncharacterized protein n=1 Tax=Pristionchus pacificus TaxID=54126 RepID=A0A2A6B337_PRIPA|nr:hypothetical protein PRIPAC_95772 [Pristionchus pacificus]|eukprot:PDM60297.1 hypothetical protein PRIPAC_54122 [Pristionchus pacificus]
MTVNIAPFPVNFTSALSLRKETKMRLPAWLLLPLTVIPILIATVHNEYNEKPQVHYALMNSTTSLALPAEIPLLTNAEFTSGYESQGRHSAEMLNGSIMDYLLIVEIALIALVVAALALIYTYVLVDYLWSYDEEEEEEVAQPREIPDPEVGVPESEEVFKIVLPKAKRRRKLTKFLACDENSSDESNTESIAESGLDFASSSEHYEEEEEEEEEEKEFRVRDPVLAEIFKKALINARFDSVNNRAEQLKTELATLKTELDSKNEQITAITNRIEQLEIQMETKHDQIGIILLFLVLYLAVCASPLFEGLHSK